MQARAPWALAGPTGQNCVENKFSMVSCTWRDSAALIGIYPTFWVAPACAGITAFVAFK